jgi:RHS repeat-associated protein
VQSSALPEALEAAGGIGGLLAVEQVEVGGGTGQGGVDAGNYVFAYDGNGHVVQVLDWAAASATAAIVAKYEYDPYGNVVASGGDYAAVTPLRFSTKYWDDETGLLYFGERYYSPKMGRWMSRNPLGEKAGADLYAFVRNHPAGAIDPLGQDVINLSGIPGPDRWPGSGEGVPRGRVDHPSNTCPSGYTQIYGQLAQNKTLGATASFTPVFDSNYSISVTAVPFYEEVEVIMLAPKHSASEDHDYPYSKREPLFGGTIYLTGPTDVHRAWFWTQGQVRATGGFNGGRRKNDTCGPIIIQFWQLKYEVHADLNPVPNLMYRYSPMGGALASDSAEWLTQDGVIIICAKCPKE